MNKVKLICLLCFAVFGVTVLFFDNSLVPTAQSFSAGPPIGFTGGPDEQNCTVCHEQNAGSGVFSINAPASYVPGQTYQLQAQHTTADATRLRWGFEMTAMDGTNVGAGTFTSTDGFTSTDIDNSNMRSYVLHTSSGTFPGTSNGATWTFNWTAPASNIGPVTFYASGNQANNNGNSDGDWIYLTNTVTLGPTPAITIINPSSGPTVGGNVVTITGTNFIAPASVTIAGSPGLNVNILDSMTINFTVPPGTAGPANVVVTTPNGTSNSLVYTYADPTPTNTNTPTATATNTPDGTSVVGTVTYGNPASPTTKFVSNATVASTVGSPSVSTTTEAPGGIAGQYSLTGFGSGAYTIGVTKTTGQNGISSADAARIAQHVSGVSLIPTDRQKIAADVTNNGGLSSTDAAQLARFVTGLGPPIGLTNQWRFFVPDISQPTFPIGASPTTRSYTDPIGVQTGQDYIGILVGEVTGNWNPTAARAVDGGQLAVAEGNGPERGIAVELPSFVATVDKRIVVPVSVDGIADKEVFSYEFDLRYDPSVIQPLVDPVDVSGTMSRGLSVVTNAAEPGLLRVVLYGAMPIEENGVLLNLRFEQIGAAGSASPLSFERIMFNEGDPRVTITDGKIELY